MLLSSVLRNMKKGVLYSALIFLFGCFSFDGIAQYKVVLDLLPGGSYVLPSPLGIYQQGEPDINFIARYKVRSFDSPVYYSYRLGVWKGNRGFELEMNHLKIYLDNAPDEVQRFSVSHGYNQLWFNYALKQHFFHWRVGLGPVIAHYENTIRGLKWKEEGGLFDMGYYVGGLSVQGAIQKKIYLFPFFYFTGEAKVSAAYVKGKVVNGYAKVPVFALHLQAGLGFEINFH